MEWLADIVETIGLKPSVLEILQTEEQYPGLMNDIATLIWQWRIIDKQVNNG